MGDVAGYIFDLDGTVYSGDGPIDGAVDTLALLREKQIPHLFVTNTTSQSVFDIIARLTGMGIPVTASSIITPVEILTRYLKRKNISRIAVEHSPALAESFPDFEISSNPEVIVLAEGGHGLDYACVNRVLEAALRGVELVALIKNKYYRRSDGLVADLGFYVAGFEYIVGRKIPVFGKPSRPMFTEALKRLGIGDPASVAIVGDDIEFDVLGGQAHGFQGFLVKTGKYLPEAVASFSEQPTRVISSIATIGEELRS